MIYYPKLSVFENAQRNGCTEANVRRYIRQHNLDRRGDEIVRRSKEILSLHKQGLNRKEISQKLGISYSTVKKYMKEDFHPEASQNLFKSSMFNNGRNDSMLKSYSFRQEEIIGNILRLYVKDGRFDIDLTYGHGGFYKHIPNPLLKFDKFPQNEDIRPLKDADLLPVECYESIVYDLPYIIRSGSTENSLIQDRYASFNSIEELEHNNIIMLVRAYKLLKKGGVLCVKTQDVNSGNKVCWVHTFIEREAERLGFQMEDMFINISKHVMLNGKNQEQRHARRYHSYFYVFIKK